jgi:hypothetical protein
MEVRVCSKNLLKTMYVNVYCLLFKELYCVVSSLKFVRRNIIGRNVKGYVQNT